MIFTLNSSHLECINFLLLHKYYCAIYVFLKYSFPMQNSYSALNYSTTTSNSCYEIAASTRTECNTRSKWEVLMNSAEIGARTMEYRLLALPLHAEMNIHASNEKSLHSKESRLNKIQNFDKTNVNLSCIQFKRSYAACNSYSVKNSSFHTEHFSKSLLQYA